MRLDIYRGSCEQAFRFYEQHQGGRINGMFRHEKAASYREIWTCWSSAR
jgi:hypothetical protein